MLRDTESNCTTSVVAGYLGNRNQALDFGEESRISCDEVVFLLVLVLHTTPYAPEG